MPITALRQFGGSVIVSAGASTTTLAYGPERRLQIIVPTVNNADVRLPDADDASIPIDEGVLTFVVVNGSATYAVRLRDQEGYIDVTLPVGTGNCALVSRVEGRGTPHFFAHIMDAA
jgi:hypothetical protein